MIFLVRDRPEGSKRDKFATVALRLRSSIDPGELAALVTIRRAEEFSDGDGTRIGPPCLTSPNDENWRT